MNLTEYNTITTFGNFQILGVWGPETRLVLMVRHEESLTYIKYSLGVYLYTDHKVFYHVTMFQSLKDDYLFSDMYTWWLGIRFGTS